MLNLVLEKGPASIRAALQNCLSASTSEDGVGSADAIDEKADESNTKQASADGATPSKGLRETRHSIETRDSDTDEEAAGLPSAPLSGSDSGGIAPSGSTMDSGVTSHAPSDDNERPDSNTVHTNSSQDDGKPLTEQRRTINSGDKLGVALGCVSTGVDVGTIDQAFRFSEHQPLPPGIFMAQLAGSGMPLPPTTTNMHYAACGGGLVTNERYHGLPLHTNNIENLRPHLSIFAKTYGIQIVSFCSELEIVDYIQPCKFNPFYN